MCSFDCQQDDSNGDDDADAQGEALPADTLLIEHPLIQTVKELESKYLTRENSERYALGDSS